MEALGGRLFGAGRRGKVVAMPRSELNEKRVRTFRHVFEAGAAVLERHFSRNGHGGADLAADRAIRNGLQRRLDAQAMLWQAQLRLHQHFSHAGAAAGDALRGAFRPVGDLVVRGEAGSASIRQHPRDGSRQS